MSISVNGIPTSNISDLFVRNQLTAKLNSGQTNLYQLETEISTGHQFQAPSQNPRRRPPGGRHTKHAGALRPGAGQRLDQPGLSQPDRLDAHERLQPADFDPVHGDSRGGLDHQRRAKAGRRPADYRRRAGTGHAGKHANQWPPAIRRHRHLNAALFHRRRGQRGLFRQRQCDAGLCRPGPAFRYQRHRCAGLRGPVAARRRRRADAVAERRHSAGGPQRRRGTRAAGRRCRGQHRHQRRPQHRASSTSARPQRWATWRG